VVKAGSDVLVADAQASFHASPRFDDLIDIEMTIAKLGNTSMVCQFHEKRGDELLVTGRIVHVFVDAKTFEKQTIPDDVREKLSRWVSTEPS
jgi:acyl-CoA thioesterase FadM